MNKSAYYYNEDDLRAFLQQLRNTEDIVSGIISGSDHYENPNKAIFNALQSLANKVNESIYINEHGEDVL